MHDGCACVVKAQLREATHTMSARSASHRATRLAMAQHGFDKLRIHKLTGSKTVAKTHPKNGVVKWRVA